MALGSVFWVMMVVGWYVIRYRFERRNKRLNVIVDDRADRREQSLLAISFSGLGILPGVFCATGWPSFANYQPPLIQTIAGVVVGLLCLVLFRLTHKQLGRNWSVTLQLHAEHSLVTDGVYRRVRHPMYSAFWMMALAQALLLPNWFAGLAGCVGFGTLFFGRVGREEAMMRQTFGAAYDAYCATTKRVIPFIY